MKHEVYSAFPCISFRNINSGTLKNVRVSISCKLSAIFSVLFLANGKHSLSVKTQFLRGELSNFHHFYCRVELFFRFTASKGIILPRHQSESLRSYMRSMRMLIWSLQCLLSGQSTRVFTARKTIK